LGIFDFVFTIHGSIACCCTPPRPQGSSAEMNHQSIRPLPIPVPTPFRIIAHRGASAYAPENTLSAFTLAEQIGVLEVELDTQLTTDGVVALCHDLTLARYGHGERMVEEMTWRALAELDMGSWFSPFLYGGEPMLSLEQLFVHFGDRFLYHVELKGRASALPAAVYALIDRFGLAQSCFVTSFAYDALVSMRRESAALRLGWLVEIVDEEVLARAEAIHLYQLCPCAGDVTAEMVSAARTVVPEVRAWGVNGESVRQQSAEIITLIDRIVEAGCDGMTINWPDWAAISI
jgi:glycerophosphoryl diester phosphodiesterase